MKKLLVIFFFFVACTGNYHPKDVGALSILEYPDNKELNKWIEIDSQYAKVYQVRRYFENFVKKDFFEEEENKIEFGKLTWFDMSEYQKDYAELLNKYQKNYKDSKFFFWPQRLGFRGISHRFEKLVLGKTNR